MAGLCQPRAAFTLVKALKEEIGLPIHFHTHDTSGIAAASVLAAIDAGADAVDGALDSMSGLTSQPNLGSIVEALRHGPRDSGVECRKPAHPVGLLGAGAALLRGVRERPALRRVRGVRARHARRAVHEPARAGALARHRRVRWPEVARAYAEVNEMFGDIVKVTPTSKVVGDMALHDGDQRAHSRAGARSAHADRLSRVGRLAVPRRSRPAVRRLPAGAAEEGSQGRAAAQRCGPARCCRRSIWRRRARSSIARPGARSPTRSSLRI